MAINMAKLGSGPTRSALYTTHYIRYASSRWTIIGMQLFVSTFTFTSENFDLFLYQPDAGRSPNLRLEEVTPTPFKIFLFERTPESFAKVSRERRYVWLPPSTPIVC